MKKLFIAMSLVLTTLCSTSCSNDETAEAVTSHETATDASQHDEWAALSDSIEALNMRTFGVAYQGTATRGKFWDWIWGKAKTDAAAALGNFLCTGGFWESVAAGGKSSVVAVVKDIIDWVTKSEAEADGRLRKTAGIPAPFQGNPMDSLLFAASSATDSAGYYHNKIILDFYDDTPGNFNYAYACSDDFTTDLCGILEGIKGSSPNAIASLFSAGTTQKALMDTLTFRAGNSLPVQGAFTETTFLTTDRKEVASKAFQQLGVYLKGLSALYGTPGAYTYTQNTLAAGAKTLKTEPGRTAFKMGVLVAFASSRLWNNTWEETEE